MRLLLVAIAAEAALFSAIAPNFLTIGNLFEMTRVIVELGMLALALTPVLVSGGIDLSVGSMMGLAAVCSARRSKTACRRSRPARGAARRPCAAAR